MPPSVTYHPSSYRDPSGFLFYKNGVLYRQINRCFKKDFDQFIQGGLYAHLAEKKILIPHQTINENLTGSEEWYQTVQPDPLPLISYPYEWCFDMLKDAALQTLEAAEEAMQFGMMLKDASAYNVQWYKGRMVFIDTLSFERYEEEKTWIAYRQFCEHFFAPLALMHYLKEPLQNLLLAWPDGLPLAIVKKLLPFKSKFRLHSYLHLHLHSAIARKHKTQNEKARSFSRQKMKNLLQSLKEGIQSFSFSEPSGIWSDYYEEAKQREHYLSSKKEIISNWSDHIPVQTVLDAGANEGEFSLLLKEKAKNIISIDADHYSVNRLYKAVRQNSIQNIHPLLIDLSHPSPAIGVNNKERSSFLSRAHADLVLALALVHHLAIGKNIPFESIAEMFVGLGKYLIIEFVPRDDEKVQRMLQHKKDIYHQYSEENFIKTFGRTFSVLDKKNISNSRRVLYFLKRNE